MTERDKARDDILRMSNEIERAVREFEQAFLGYTDETIAEVKRLTEPPADIYDVEAHEVTQPIQKPPATISFGMPPNPMTDPKPFPDLKLRSEEDPSDFWGLKKANWYGDKPVPATPALLLFVGMAAIVIGIAIALATEGYTPVVRAIFSGFWVVLGVDLSAYGVLRFMEDREKEAR